MLLVDEAVARTRVEYDADAVVGGVVGGVGQRMLGGVARKLAGQFFTGMDGLLTREAARPPTRPATKPRWPRPRPWCIRRRPGDGVPDRDPAGPTRHLERGGGAGGRTRRSGRGAERRGARLCDGPPERPTGASMKGLMRACRAVRVVHGARLERSTHRLLEQRHAPSDRRRPPTGPASRPAHRRTASRRTSTAPSSSSSAASGRPAPTCSSSPRPSPPASPRASRPRNSGT